MQKVKRNANSDDNFYNNATNMLLSNDMGEF